MMNHATTEVFFDDLRVPAENLIGEEGKGFRYILSGMNAERILIAAECVGDAKWFIDKASAYAKERVVFGRPIGQNQGIQFPIARAYANMRAAELMVREAAAALRGRPEPAARRPTWPRCWRRTPPSRPPNACIQTHGGFGFAEEYDIERKFRETRLYQVAPISTNLILVLSRRARARAAALLLSGTAKRVYCRGDRAEARARPGAPRRESALDACGRQPRPITEDTKMWRIIPRISVSVSIRRVRKVSWTLTLRVALG